MSALVERREVPEAERWNAESIFPAPMPWRSGTT